METSASWIMDGQTPEWFEASVDDLEEAWALEVARRTQWFGLHAEPPTPLSGSLAEVLDHVRYTPGTNLLVGTTGRSNKLWRPYVSCRRLTQLAFAMYTLRTLSPRAP